MSQPAEGAFYALPPCVACPPSRRHASPRTLPMTADRLRPRQFTIRQCPEALGPRLLSALPLPRQAGRHSLFPATDATYFWRSFRNSGRLQRKGQVAVQPPSTGRAAPVISRPPGPHRKAISPATLPGSTKRPAGRRPARYCRVASASLTFFSAASLPMRARISGVGNVPGHIALQMMSMSPASAQWRGSCR